MMLLLAGITIATAGVISAAGTIAAMKLARKWGFIDLPTPDRFHKTPTPLLGGVAIFAGIVIPTVVVVILAAIWNATAAPGWLDDSIKVHIPGVLYRLPLVVTILVGGLLLCIIGLIDDKKPMGPWLKLSGQLLVAAGVVLIGKIRLLELAGEPISTIATILWLVLITNAINFMDNMDGLAAGVVVICSAALLASAAAAGQLFVAGWLCLILGASIGFLPFNFPPAKIFMGDAGSLPLGFMLGIASVLTTYYHGGSSGVYYSIFTPVVAMAIPIYDTISVVLLRLIRGKNPMVGDRRHFSHRLVRLGMMPRKALFTIYLATATTAAGAALLPRVDKIGAIMIFAQTVAVVLIIALLESSAIGSRL
ncbi:MAG: undecaprenyl/decaprenyl-phosphate alpha-N-acetylglucosaminyl 1-phosphate transferase [Planctomycetes bacterium]|nr:undecaprenyl/decaprenyl-phosphate alpha-N-acetylglucosaminyl 1-phosphate transferase [Planctomycetota bacterium]